VSIRFKGSDYKFDMRQRFLGIREENNVNVVIAHTNFVGLLPEIPEGAAVKMATYSEEYEKKGPGKKYFNHDFRFRFQFSFAHYLPSCLSQETAK